MMFLQATKPVARFHNGFWTVECDKTGISVSSKCLKASTEGYWKDFIHWSLNKD